MVTQDHVAPSIRPGANLTGPGDDPRGAAFRVWVPRAETVYLNGRFGGAEAWDRDTNPALALRRIPGTGDWGGFVSGAAEGDPYKFFVVGAGSSGYKRDPRARERRANGDGVIRNPAAYRWRDQGFRPPAFNDLVIYQLHVGTFFHPPDRVGGGTFLDVVEKIPYLAALGVNALQLLPVTGFETENSEGYNECDYFAPEHRYAVTDPAALTERVATVNRLLAAKDLPPIRAEEAAAPYHQLKLLAELCHLHGIAVHLDVVYNHAGGFEGDDESIYNWDRQREGEGGDTGLYFTAQNMPSGGLPFALWKREVRAFLIDNARYLLDEFHIDGLRYDEVSLLAEKNTGGWRFCRDLTGTLRFLKPAAFHNAEFWPVNPGVVAAADAGGAGFDATQNDGLREAVRAAVGQAARGRGAMVDMDRVARNLADTRLSPAGRRCNALKTMTRCFAARARGSAASPTLPIPGRGTRGAGPGLRSACC